MLLSFCTVTPTLRVGELTLYVGVATIVAIRIVAIKVLTIFFIFSAPS